MNNLILITRPKQFAKKLASQLLKANYQTFLFPTITIEPIMPVVTPDLALFKKLIFISQSAVEHFFQHTRLSGYTGDVIAVGRATAALLTLHGVNNVIVPAEQNSEGVLTLHELQVIQQQNILIVAGLGGKETLQTELTQRGARVEKLAVYQRSKPQIDTRELKTQWSNISTIVCTSGESLNNLIDLLHPQLGEELFDKALLVISKNMLNLAEHLGFHTIIQAATAHDDDIIHALNQWKESYD
tara:strand:+ start:76001 stop:76729 length:729 start_codon:yes stop_codon:yes gene_type:complete